ncbi:MAG TPA: glycosyltransferase family 4 protein [Gemmatimonadaceae bacterium]|nr:glycosyltransferase family 4 protein [Gemmatimonadaceae bacterium]
MIDTSTVSGPGRQLAALAGELRQRDVELHVLTFQRRGRPVSPFPGLLSRLGVPHTVIEESGPADFGLVGRLRDALTELDPAVVQTHGYRPTALMYASRSLGERRPWLAFFHGSTSENLKVRAYNWLDQRLLRGADRVVLMSERHLAQFGRARTKARVVYNAVLRLEDDATSLATTNERFEGLSLANPTIGVLGRLSPEKGVDVFLRAMRTVYDRGIRASVVVAGDGPEHARLLGLRQELRLEKDVHFIGAIPAPQAFYARMDLVVLPSLSEGLPNVMLEALQAGVPVVATDVGAVREVLGASAAGVVVPPGSPDSLADGIVAGLGLSSDSRFSAARRDVVERFSLERRAESLCALYAELVGSSTR